MQQLYKFAELGQLTTVILHDLANYLSVLALDIDDLNEKSKNNEAIARTKESIQYLDTMVTDARRRIKVTDEYRRFNIITEIKKITNELKQKSSRHRVDIRLHIPSRRTAFYVFGDPLRLSQVVTILVNNAVDASMTFAEDTVVDVEVKILKDTAVVSVIDYGAGIPPALRASLFEPKQSTKQNGLGIGLYIAKQVVETHFKGTLSLRKSEPTTFSLSISEATIAHKSAPRS